MFPNRWRGSRAAGSWTACTSTNSSASWRIASVLIVRLDGIGDALVCTPLIAALKAAGHDVGAALSDRNADVFAAGTLARRHVLERIPWPAHGSTPESRRRAAGEIAAAAYDVALIASEEPEAYELAAPVPQRVGFTTGWAKPLKNLWIRKRVTRAIHRAASAGREAAHEVEILFRLGDGWHAERAPTADLARLRPLVLDDPAPVRREAIVVQLGAKWMGIGLDRTAAGAIVAHLAERGAQLIASAAEREAAEALCGPAPYVVLDSLSAWKRSVDAARILVTPDTGAAHLAGMLGVPTVDCFPAAGARAQIARWRPWAAPYAALTAAHLAAGDAVARLERALHGL